MAATPEPAGGVGFSSDTLGRAVQEAGHTVDAEVLAPMQRWLEMHAQLAVSWLRGSGVKRGSNWEAGCGVWTCLPLQQRCCDQQCARNANGHGIFLTAPHRTHPRTPSLPCNAMPLPAVPLC